MAPPQTLLIFDQLGGIWAFSSVEAAEGAAEILSLDDGEYDGAFTSDGHVVVLAPASGQPGVIRITDAVDHAELARLLDVVAARRGQSWPSSNPAEIAALLLRETWEQRWPKRPRWLSRRLHGEEPTVGGGG